MCDAKFGVVVAVNDDEVLKGNLKRSSCIVDGATEIFEVRGAESASIAYNKGLEHFINKDYVIFAHQDVYLPIDWLCQLKNSIDVLSSEKQKWGVIGVFGKDTNGQAHGQLWDSGMGRELGAAFGHPIEVSSIDEVVIVINNNALLNFDERLIGFHLYGADISTTARQQGYGTYVVNAPIIHNSKPIVSLGGDYAIAHKFIQRKWQSKLPIHAVCGKVTKWSIEYKRIRYGLAVRRFFGRLRKPTNSHLDPREIAQNLGYEKSR